MAGDARKRFLLRLDPAVYRALESWAADELRSVNGQIEWVLVQALMRRRRLAADWSPRHDDAPATGDPASAEGSPPGDG